MPIYAIWVNRQRTVFDEATIKVRADSIEALEEVDVEALETAGQIHWNCDHHDETDGIEVMDIEELDGDEDYEVDLMEDEDEELDEECELDDDGEDTEDDSNLSEGGEA
jgi:hypothetical protein